MKYWSDTLPRDYFSSLYASTKQLNTKHDNTMHVFVTTSAILLTFSCVMGGKLLCLVICVPDLS